MFATKKGGSDLIILICENYVVSFDSLFLLSELADFPRGKQNYKAHADIKNNTNTYRYQLVIGGNNAKIIGIYLIDSGSLKKAEIAHDLFRP